MSDLLHGAYSALSRLEDWFRANGSFTSSVTVAIIAWFLASLYQGRSKRWELRAAIYLEANRIHYRLHLAAGMYNFVGTAGSAQVQEKRVSGSEVPIIIQVQAGDYVSRFHETIFEAIALGNAIDLHFTRKQTRSAYRDTVHYFGLVGDPDRKAEADKNLDSAKEAWRLFLREAAREMGVRPLWRRLQDRLRRKAESPDRQEGRRE